MAGIRPGRVRAVGLCLVAGLLVGCSSGNVSYWESSPVVGDAVGEWVPKKPPRPPGERTAEEAFSLLRESDSMRLSISMNAPRMRARFSLHADRDGNCAGTFDMGRMQRGDVIRVAGEDTIYVRYTDEALAEWRKEAARRGPEVSARANKRTALARGKYLKMPADSGASQGQCDLDKALSSVPRDGKGARQRPVVERNGERVIPVRGPEGDEDLTMYVAAEGKPYIQFMEGEYKGAEMKIEFSQYGKPVRAVAPPASQVLEIQVGNGGLLDA
ncbi:hypothetical protein [Streptomyces gobiensis]|uniref:hypothetical protein n=1 Tax=Streptomyces gobiensis TaxID=2875706 RepID=UPI001E2DB4E2|nr:hypothetical protein [Streptomyces gobiensis]UGY93258.1 hypothetical protein test1122_17070 [Streptomyces gobiensis]